MYGEGNSAKLLSDIVNGTTQVTEGISAGMGIDIKSLIMGALGGKLAADSNSAPVVVVENADQVKTLKAAKPAEIVPTTEIPTSEESEDDSEK